MAEKQSSAPVPASGVIHVRTRLTANFTVVSNRLAQRRGSAIAQGIALYIASLPDGAPVTIAALCEHFTEGEIRIARALNELEAAGYLERRRERLPDGRIRTRTFFYDVPRAVATCARPPQPRPKADPKPTRAATTPAVAVLAGLRHLDSRLLLSEGEIARLAPAVEEWLERGAQPQQISDALSDRLPRRLKQRPARLLAYRLAAYRPPGTPAAEPQVLIPFQTCDGCERAYRAIEPGRCRECRGDVVHVITTLRAAG